MSSNSKVYVVSEYGGEYEDRWERIVGVCSSSELADRLKHKIEERFNSDNCILSEEDYESMMDRFLFESNGGYNCDSILDGLSKMFPECPREEIEKAMMLYDWEEDFCGVTIREVDLFNNPSDIEQ